MPAQNKKPLQKREVLSLYMQDYPSLISQNKYVLQDLAPIPFPGTVAGHHRASPSATLDKRMLV